MKVGQYRTSMFKSILLSGLLLFAFGFSSLAYSDSQAIIISQPLVKDLADHDLAQAAVNSQVILSFKIRHTGDGEQPYIVLIEVRDANQVTTYLQFQKGKMSGTSEIEIGSSWTPTTLGDYEVRTFVISDLQQPEILSPIVSSKAVVSFVEARKQVEQDVEQNMPQEDPVTPPELDELRKYALEAINKDRAKYNLSSVKLSSNEAAQVHAADILQTKAISHWMTNGEKPYMTYSRYGGEGNVGQNVGVSGDWNHSRLCVTGLFMCEKVDPYEDIEIHEYGMMYEDKECCDNGHRENILDKYHTHVSIGIAYDDYFFVIVQNFEDNYVDWVDRIDDEDSNTISMSGHLRPNRDGYSSNDIELYTVGIYYDPLPTRETYEENLDQLSYGFGEYVASVVEPARQGYSYELPSDYTLIEADWWLLTQSEFQITFNMENLRQQHGDGVYAVSIWCQNAEEDSFLAATISMFKD